MGKCPCSGLCDVDSFGTLLRSADASLRISSFAGIPRGLPRRPQRTSCCPIETRRILIPCCWLEAADAERSSFCQEAIYCYYRVSRTDRVDQGNEREALPTACPDGRYSAGFTARGLLQPAFARVASEIPDQYIPSAGECPQFAVSVMQPSQRLRRYDRRYV